MKRHLLTILFSTAVLTSAIADSTVVFNELMYRSHTNEAANEWIELHNQMAVNMDISGWSLADGIEFKFADGTVIPGGGYLVIASSPATLLAAGVTNVVGPFTGRLSNSGEAIELLNNNQRLMDLVEYEADDDSWPSGPDGSGVALAKRNENSASGKTANWTSSLQVGGTPGAANFPSALANTVTTTLVPINATWRYEQSGANPGANWSKTNFNDGGWASATALFANETCDCLPEPIGTTLLLGRTNYYFRTTFNFTGNPAQTTLNLRHIIDDGLVVYLNGTEIWRIGMPVGTITPDTLASRAVPNAAYEGSFTVPSTALVNGENILAVEVHQHSIGSTDVVFGLSLTESHLNTAEGYEKPTLAFNEVAGTNTPFWLELINYGTDSITLDGMAIVGLSGTRPEYIFPPATILGPGEILQVAGTTLAFIPNPNSKLALYTANRSNVVDAVTIRSISRARFPDGVGAWITPTVETPGASNLVTLRNEIVINEIMYDHRPLPTSPGPNSPTNVLISSTNLWRYHQEGIDLGTNWRQTGYNDNSWPIGNALFHAIPAFLPAPKNTPLQLTNGSGQRLVTWYFRTPFVFTGDVVSAELVLNPIIDDGAVFYLNGTEVHRHNMPNGTITYDTLANVSVATPVFTGPISVPKGILVPGTNYLAVEVHQFATNFLSVDVAFGTELLVTSFVSPPLAELESPESWIELHNQSSNVVSLAGWTLDDGIEFVFATNQTIAPGGYLVVAQDPAYMLSLYPSLNVVGPFEKSLSGSSDHLVLRDAFGNLADAVRYYDDGRWPEYANGAGSSLELRDPRADNAEAEAWDASDESTKTGWNTYTYRGIATAEAASSPTLWRELVLGMLDAGEVLLDDISVIESPEGSSVQFIQNGNFSSGLTSWRILGNHKGKIVSDPDNAGNNVLHLVATGSTGHMHNHVETTFANNAQVINGREYEISYRAKWIAGNNGLLSRLYFNRLPRATSLAVPELNGTPGARNSRYATNIGPTYVGFRHTPVVPQPGEPVSVFVKPSDPDGVSTMTLRWSANGGAWNQTSMVAQASGEWSGNIPGANAGTLVQFFVEGMDGAGTISTFPAGGTNSRALYKVNDGGAIFDQLHNIRILMTTADSTLLHAPTNVMSSDFMGTTVIYNEEQVFYDMKVHLQGSQRGRPNSARVGFTLRFNPDDLFRGVHETISIDRSGGYSGRGGKQDEILIKHAVNRAGGLPGMYDDLTHVLAPRIQENSTGLMLMSKYNKVFLDSQYENGSDGGIFKLELIYYPTTTSDGTPQGYKLPNPDQVLGTDFRDLGDDKEAYRWNFLNENHAAADDFSGIIKVAKTLGLTGGALDTASRQTLDVDEWMRAFALESLFGVSDSYGFGLTHNFMVYIPPDNQKALALLWDMDVSFSRAANSALTPGGNIGNLIALPGNLRLYYSHLYDLISTTVNTSYLGPWANHYSSLLGENWSAAVTYIGQRTSHVLGQLPTATTFAITSNGGNDFSVSNAFVALTGTAPIQLETIQVNGINHSPSWTSATDWMIETPLVSGTNFLTLQGVNRYGGILSNLVDTIQVVNQAQVTPPKPVVINEWMADNAGPGGFRDPVDNVFQDWFELYNPNTNAFDLSGYFLTDTLAQSNKFQIPANTFIAGNGFLLVWADNEPAQNGLSPFGDLHVNFALGKGGEDLALFAPNGTLQSSVTFGAQQENISQGLYEDGNTNTIHFMPNWTPRAANQLNAPPMPSIGPVTLMANGSITFDWPATLHRNYRVDFKDSLDAAMWLPLSTNSAVNGAITVTDTNTTGAQRFYRVVLLD